MGSKMSVMVLLDDVVAFVDHGQSRDARKKHEDT